MLQEFYKYQGTGNDFVLIDNRQFSFSKSNTSLINHICDRRFGIGADGLILLEPSEKLDFKMVYFNADGKESTMCGNGGRCIVAFAKFLNIIDNDTTFEAIDGVHYAKIEEDIVHLQMIDVTHIKEEKSYSFLNTGSPHHVQLVDDLSDYNVFKEGAKIRYSNLYKDDNGTNVNFVTKNDNNSFRVRTYERGVENETLSCGTGVTAVALAMYNKGLTTSTFINLQVEGGELKVSFNPNNNAYTNIFLIGKATQVFKGEIIC